jgi:hypothetical protein
MSYQPGDSKRMAAGIAALARADQAWREREQHQADLAAARPAPPAIADRPGRADRRVAEARRCPFCHALPGQQCHTSRGRPMQPHPSRLDAART